MKYALPAAWLLVFAYRLLLGGDRFSLWLLRLLTAAIVVAVCFAAARFVIERVRSTRRGESLFTEATVRGLLIATAVLGLVLRIVGWDPGHEGIVAWVGGIMLLLAIGGFIALQFWKEKAAATGHESFYFNPYWRYGLLLACIATLAIQGLVRPVGIGSTLNVAVFWIALIALIVQSVGRWVRRRRGHGSGAPTGPFA